MFKYPFLTFNFSTFKPTRTVSCCRFLHLLHLITSTGNMKPYQLSVFVTSHKLEKSLNVQFLMSHITASCPGQALLLSVICLQAVLKSASFRSCSLLGLQAGAASHAWLFLEHRRALSAGSAVFEGPPVPLISRGTPRRERAPSPGPPHCSVLFLYPRSPHSVKLRGTSSISPVPHVNRRFNQTLLFGLPLCSPSNTLSGRKIVPRS